MTDGLKELKHRAQASLVSMAKANPTVALQYNRRFRLAHTTQTHKHVEKFGGIGMKPFTI